ncbi:TlpA family protein disulfide reductase [Deferrisoma palaeochoriense]
MRKLFTMLVGALAVVAVGTAGLAQEGPKYGTNVGDVAKPVKIHTMDGDEFDTGKIEEKTLFVFVNSICGLCAKEMKDLAKNADSLKKVKVYLVSVDQNKERAMKVYEKFQKLFGLLHDPEYSFGEAVGLYATPSTLLLDKGGKILFKKTGYRGDVDEILKAL